MNKKRFTYRLFKTLDEFSFFHFDNISILFYCVICVYDMNVENYIVLKRE